MTNLSKRKYDLEERTFNFGGNIVLFCKEIKVNTVNRPLLSQIIRSGTSVGANYCEANNASSKKDFRNKICICKKEAQETKYWLKIIEKSEGLSNKNSLLQKECQELILIFQKIISTIKD